MSVGCCGPIALSAPLWPNPGMLEATAVEVCCGCHGPQPGYAVYAMQPVLLSSSLSGRACLGRSGR